MSYKSNRFFNRSTSTGSRGSNRAHVFAGVVAACALVAHFGAYAHGDEDHGNGNDKAAPAAATATATASAAATSPFDAGAPQRQPDGSLWMPKAAQHRLGLRTVLAQTQAHAVAIELAGRVIGDPNAGGRVQATQAGRIEAGPKGLPVLGQAVAKGEVLAYLRPAASSIDRANQQAALAELDAQYALAERRLARYEQLEGAVPQKDVEAARLERDALKKRRAAVGASVAAPEPLVAPVAGTLAASSVVIGQVVDARDVLFEIVDARHLAIEALAYDPAAARDLRDASAQVPGGSLTLAFVGGGGQLRDQALPLLFRITRGDAPVAVGQSVKVVAKTSRSIEGVAVPRAALTRNAAGDSTVWLHAAAERFTPRVVQLQPLDADTVVITSGLHAGERVVTVGASLLAQVR